MDISIFPVGKGKSSDGHQFIKDMVILGILHFHMNQLKGDFHTNNLKIIERNEFK